jgi:phosphoribosyl-ATP pyrophosphohydrolase/phosphoribosyl-AMP cyclohydrolase
MIIPSIDLMGGRAVQLRRGVEMILEAPEDPRDLARRFAFYGEVAVVDLDAALGRGSNRALVRELCRLAPCRVGGGVRTEEDIVDLIKAGTRVVIGTAATEAVARCARLGRGARRPAGGRSALAARWRTPVGRAPAQGSLLGVPVPQVGRGRSRACRSGRCRPYALRRRTADDRRRRRRHRGHRAIEALGCGAIGAARTPAGDLDRRHQSPRQGQAPLPTVVQDGDGRVRMLAFNGLNSLAAARLAARGLLVALAAALWRREDSGHTAAGRGADCDADALLCTVGRPGRPTTPANPHASERRQAAGLDRHRRIIAARRAAPEADPTRRAARIAADRAGVEEAAEACEARRHNNQCRLPTSCTTRGADGGGSPAEVESEAAGRHR